LALIFFLLLLNCWAEFSESWEPTGQEGEDVPARHAVCQQAGEASRQSKPASGKREIKHKIPYKFFVKFSILLLHLPAILIGTFYAIFLKNHLWQYKKAFANNF
jgi:hypothetical protein